MKDSNELFELCKQVYKATGWYGSGSAWIDGTPIYSSDYLLEKLPNGTTILKDVHGFKAWNIYNRKRIATYTCDSPVEALLKLTLKLHEEGLL